MPDPGNVRPSPDRSSCFTLERPERGHDERPAMPKKTDLPPGMFAMMAVTTLATFGTLTGTYELLF